MKTIEEKIEDIQEKAENTNVPNTSYTLSDYLYGRCQIFAQAFHEELGYEMQFLWDTDYWFEDADSSSIVLVHSYCILPQGEYVDARGAVSKEMIVCDYECNYHHYENYSLDKLKVAYNNNILEEPTKAELASVRKFIRQNIKNYQ